MIAGPFGVSIDIFRLWPIDSIRFVVVRIQIALWPLCFDLFDTVFVCVSVFLEKKINENEHENGSRIGGLARRGKKEIANLYYRYGCQF